MFDYFGKVHKSYLSCYQIIIIYTYYHVNTLWQV